MKKFKMLKHFRIRLTLKKRQQVAQGLSDKEIATELFLSEGTVRNDLVIIMDKMYVNNRL